MRSAGTRVCPAIGLLVALATAGAHADEAQVLSRGRWRGVKARTVGEVKGFRPRTGGRLSPYGGRRDRRRKATGFFRTEKVDGRWWLVDPDGCLFLSVGLNSVNDGTFAKNAIENTFGSDAKWAAATGKLLKENGFNSLACWSDWRAFRPTPQRMPYFTRWNIMSSYKNRRDRKNGARGFPNECMPVFDPEFEAFAEKHCRQLAAWKDDPYLIGHFSDNELPFRPESLENFLELPKNDTGYTAARAWWDRRRGRTGRSRIEGADNDAFLEHLAARYYAICRDAIKKHDPNHLYVGSRIHGRTIRAPVLKGSKAVDVVSVNYYHRWSAETERLARWVKDSGRPFLISEYYAQSLESARTEATGAGFRVKSDRDRGLFYQNLMLGLLESPGCVGWHWFKYGGDGKGFHKGVVNPDFEPHKPLLDLMRQLNRQVYPLADHFRQR